MQSVENWRNDIQCHIISFRQNDLKLRKFHIDFSQIFRQINVLLFS